MTGPMTGWKYSTFLTETLPVFTEEVSLSIRAIMRYKHDDYLTHFARQLRVVLQTLFCDQWIGRGRWFLWAPRSPGLTPLDYFLWSTLKSKVYCKSPVTVEDTTNKIIGTCTFTTKTIVSAMVSLINRLGKCIKVKGHYFVDFSNQTLLHLLIYFFNGYFTEDLASEEEKSKMW